MKLSLKIILLFTAIVSGILLSMAIIIYSVSRQNIQDEFRDRLSNRAYRTTQLYNVFQDDSSGLMKSLDANSPPALVNRNVNIYNSGGIKLYEHHDDSTNVLEPDSSWFNLPGAESKFYKFGNKDVCIYRDTTGKEPFIVMVAAENISGQQFITDLKRIFFLFFPVAILASLLVGRWFSHSIIRPIRETIHDVQLITTQNLSHRLFVGKRKDELAELNATFNDLLNRLEESFAIQRRFISNASHEMSTPLTAVSSQIEVALLHNRSEGEYRRVLNSILEDVRHLHQLTKTLLEIAKAGTHGTISLDKVRIDEVLVKAHGELVRQNPSFQVGLEFSDLPEKEEECMVFGNAPLLQSAFKNIMENGCKYSPDNTTLVQLFFRGDKVELVFLNKGDFIQEEEMNRLFEPFYRGKNADGKQGVGLGLTLTKRIISLHKGNLLIESHPDKGTMVKLTLPTLKT